MTHNTNQNLRKPTEPRREQATLSDQPPLGTSRKWGFQTSGARHRPIRLVHTAACTELCQTIHAGHGRHAAPGEHPFRAANCHAARLRPRDPSARVGSSSSGESRRMDRRLPRRMPAREDGLGADRGKSRGQRQRPGRITLHEPFHDDGLEPARSAMRTPQQSWECPRQECPPAGFEPATARLRRPGMSVDGRLYARLCQHPW